jgi:Zn-dependent protease
MLLFHIGWAKPVPINPRNFKNPKRGFAICALAGPLSNIILAFFSAGFYLLFLRIFSTVHFESEFAFNLASNFLLFLFLLHSINIGLGIFNLIPVPPLDGSRLLTVILPEQTYFKIMKNERRIYITVVLWLLLGDYAKNAMLSVAFIAKNSILSALAGFLSLSDMLSAIIESLSDGMMWLWQLIPFLK